MSFSSENDTLELKSALEKNNALLSSTFVGILSFFWGVGFTIICLILAMVYLSFWG